MKSALLLLVSAISVSASFDLNPIQSRPRSSAARPPPPPHALEKRQTQYDASTEYWFDQWVDHNDQTKGTFKQRYFFSDEFYAGTGAPVILNGPGEQSADGFDSDLTGASLQNAMMELYGAAGVVLEHRYWGKSSPYANLTSQTLVYLTVDQAIQDFVNFAQTVQLPFRNGSISTHPDTTPWVNIGCSYPGMLVAFIQEKHSDVFTAGWATSAPVQADGDFWEYYEPIEEGMPKNCSSDVVASIAYIDNVLTTGTPDAQTSLKQQFGMEALSNDDFANAITWPFNTWQDLQAYDFANEGESLFHQFCDSIETQSDGTINMAEQGVGLPQALTNWAAAFKALGPDEYCPGTGGSCYTSYDYTSGQYTDTSVSDTWMRAWTWLLCTQLGWFQPGDPGNTSSIVSSLVTPSYFTRECNYMFPNADGTPGNFSPGSTSNTTDDTDVTYQGWNLMANNLFVVNGQYDPWRSASLSSVWAPGFVDTPTQDINVIPNAHHCWDFYLTNSEYDQNVTATQKEGINKIYGWLGGWYTNHPTVPNVLKALPASITSNTTSTDGISSSLPDGGSLNGTIPDGTSGSNVNSLQDKIDQLEGNKKLALASYILNAVLLLLLIGALVMLVLSRRKVHKAAGGGGFAGIPMSRPKWQNEELAPYGAGASAGGRGQYQKVVEQH